MNPALPIHPAAELFPMLDDHALASLAANIRDHGQHEPIVVWRGQLLDGRNRRRACALAGVEPIYADRSAEIKDPYRYAWGVNAERRHLTPSQLAMVGARLRAAFEIEAKERMRMGGRAAAGDAEASASLREASAIDSAERAAELAGVSTRSVESASRVLKLAPVVLVRAVEAGAVKVSAAATVAGLPASEVEELVARGPKEILAKAKELRKAAAAERKPRDAYMSAGGFVRPLLPVLGEPGPLGVLECCAGAGDLVAPLRAAGHRVVTADVDPAAAVDHHLDMRLASSWAGLQPVDWVVSNLPFSVAIEILPHAIAHARRGVAVILRLTFLEPTKERAAWLAAHPLTKQIVLPRYSFTGDGNVDSVTCAWMVWERGEPGRILIPMPDENGMPGDLPPDGELVATVAGVAVAADAAQGQPWLDDVDDDDSDAAPDPYSERCSVCNRGAPLPCVDRATRATGGTPKGGLITRPTPHPERVEAAYRTAGLPLPPPRCGLPPSMKCKAGPCATHDVPAS